MSRVIVKNLPNGITADKVKETFSEFGRVTDVQLKYTSDGKFRKFGFIGFETSDEAKNALSKLNKTFIGTSRIDVQVCAELGDVNKPKSWSKYAADSSAFQKLHGNKIDSLVAELLKNKTSTQKKKKKTVAPDLIESLKKYLDHPHFLDFLELRGKKEFVLDTIKEHDSQQEVLPAEESVKDKEKEDEKENNSLAFSAISDSEYLKLKTTGTSEKKEFIPKISSEPSPKAQFYNVKIRNLPCKAKKKDVKEFLMPLVPASIRFIPKVKGVAYAGFKTEKEMRQALVKNKSFLSGKQILICEVKDKVKLEKSDKWIKQEESLKNEECIAESGRIFVRNLPYSVTEEELENLFKPFGDVTEVILPIDKFTRKIRGYGVITFLMPEHAVAAYCKLDGTIFHGRMLHLLPGKAKEEEENEDNAGGNYKSKKEKNLKSVAGCSHNWNTLFLDMNAVADVIADKYKCSREDVLTGADAAVRLALGETQIVNETKQFLEENGVCLDAFNQQVTGTRSKTIILVKNLPAKTSISEIHELFVKYGELGRVVLPPSGVTGIVEFLEQSEAKVAFKNLAYSKFKHLPLYLEWAPNNTFTENKKEEKEHNSQKDELEDGNNIGSEPSNEIDSDSDSDDIKPEENTTIFIKNLNLQTTEDVLKKHFECCGKVASVQVAKKKDPKDPRNVLSLGYGFVQFYLQSEVNEALKRLQGSQLEGHALEIKRSNKTLVAQVVNTRKTTNLKVQTGSKILVRNVPFQATVKEIEKLFRTFGELKFVRLPKKLVGTGPHRGFAFVEFLSKHDAKRAMKALCQSTHLFGRRLVLEWAKEDESVVQLRKRTANHFHPDGRKSNKKVLLHEDETQEETLVEM